LSAIHPARQQLRGRFSAHGVPARTRQTSRVQRLAQLRTEMPQPELALKS
jgi:hypothetical protein